MMNISNLASDLEVFYYISVCFDYKYLSRWSTL